MLHNFAESHNCCCSILEVEQITRGWDIYGCDLVTSDHPGSRPPMSRRSLSIIRGHPAQVMPGSGYATTAKYTFVAHLDPGLDRRGLQSDASKLLTIPSSLDEQL